MNKLIIIIVVFLALFIYYWYTFHSIYAVQEKYDEFVTTGTAIIIGNLKKVRAVPTGGNPPETYIAYNRNSMGYIAGAISNYNTVMMLMPTIWNMCENTWFDSTAMSLANNAQAMMDVYTSAIMEKLKDVVTSTGYLNSSDSSMDKTDTVISSFSEVLSHLKTLHTTHERIIALILGSVSLDTSKNAVNASRSKMSMDVETFKKQVLNAGGAFRAKELKKIIDAY